MKKLIWTPAVVVAFAALLLSGPAFAQAGWTVGTVVAGTPQIVVITTANGTANPAPSYSSLNDSMDVKTAAQALWGPSSKVSQETATASITVPFTQNFKWVGYGPPSGTITSTGNSITSCSASQLPTNPGENYADSSVSLGSSQAGSNDTRTSKYSVISKTYPFSVSTNNNFTASCVFTLKAESVVANDYYDYYGGSGKSTANSEAQFTCETAK